MIGHLNAPRSDRSRWTPWDSAPDPDDTAGPVRVYCLPHAGGSAGSYLPWARGQHQPGLRFVPVELPGRGTRLAEEPLRSMDQVVDGLLDVLAHRPADERFMLFGHSMGSQIAYETARRLAAEELPLPVSVIVSGGRPPGAPAVATLHDLNDDRLMKGIVELGGTPAEVLEHQDLVDLLLPVIRADLKLLADYTTRVRPTVLPCPVVALGGADDKLAGPEWISGWRSTTAARFRHRILPGDHFFLHTHRAEVIAELAAEAADRDAPGHG
ncbi:alpha/beta fold hydrolase [Streptomyces sp. NBC_00291]|uniref:thioesterase II family protein n=1 Tax=Streptomyces sp. NBC_00291 TaxID=2975704 RepID=UPI0022591043|nr:alpha/beta fold hydrolase [Streptomyces sp. NBC_00291]MCX5157154.1 alpha/beta fold hydrolase [Streptomyces sp. NBC_00291]